MRAKTADARVGFGDRGSTAAAEFSNVVESSRASTGILGLDERLEGGFPANRAILVTGEPGSGKSTLGLQFIAAGIERGEAGICVSVDQKPRHLLQDVLRFGWNLEDAVNRGKLTLLDASPYFTKIRNKSKGSMPVDACHIATDLSHQVANSGARRVVIDSLTSLVPPELSRALAQDYLRSLILSLEDNLNCTVVLTCRASSGDPQGICEAAEYLVSGIVELKVRHAFASFVRTMFIKKMRGTNTRPEEYPYDIRNDRGMVIMPA